MKKPATDLDLPTEFDFPFTRPVCLEVGGAWITVESAEQAMACLRHCFDDQTAPSLVRAISTCAASLHAKVPPDAAQATLIVAAMEAGFAFEVLEVSALELERQVEAAAAEGLAEILLAEAAE